MILCVMCVRELVWWVEVSTGTVRLGIVGDEASWVLVCVLISGLYRDYMVEGVVVVHRKNP